MFKGHSIIHKGGESQGTILCQHVNTGEHDVEQSHVYLHLSTLLLNFQYLVVLSSYQDLTLHKTHDTIYIYIYTLYIYMSVFICGGSRNKPCFIPDPTHPQRKEEGLLNCLKVARQSFSNWGRGLGRSLGCTIPYCGRQTVPPRSRTCPGRHCETEPCRHSTASPLPLPPHPSRHSSLCLPIR